MNTIGIEGQWILGIQLEYKGSVIPKESLGKLVRTDLKEFFIIEEASNLLPTVRISFMGTNKWEQYWNENSKLIITLGITENGGKVVNSKFTILSSKATDLGNSLFIYEASCVYDAAQYTQTPHIRTIGPTNGTEAIQQTTKLHFKNVKNTANSSESLPWYQMNTSDKKLVDNVICRCYIPKSFVSCGITSNGDFILIDTVKTCKENAKYIIGEDIILIDTPKLKSNSAFLNSQGIYGLDVPISSGEYGVSSTTRIDIDLGLVPNKTPNVGNIARRTTNTQYFNSCNVDENYNIAKYQYGVGQALTSVEQMTLKAVDMETPIQVLDIIDVPKIISNSENSSQDTSGKYIVNKVIRGISNNVAILKIIAGRNSHKQQ